MTEETIFAQALEIGDRNAQQDFLNRACGHDFELRARLDALLSAQKSKDSLLDNPINLDVTTAPRQSSALLGVGSLIGPYKLLEEIGEGGMGIVYVAEREKPVRQRVAIKIIKPGMDTREVIARFEAERQALALMDHPNVAKVLDAGTTASGQPYFVMEHIKGVPITEYCDEQKLSTRQRLNLFRQVCLGVQHSHQKGIIHRDLKPSNILIAEYDHEPVVKIIDFGVAKALNQSLTEKTLYTRRLNIIGTLQYMSPEQAKINQRDIDTRSDIYSLGVILYELLTSRPPIERKTLEAAGFDGMRRMIREKDPPKPSEKLKTLDANTGTDVAKHRSSELHSLSKLMRGDLDLLVMTALEKDRNRRYETANGLCKDIERYLNNDSLSVRPPTIRYRFWKTYLRNKAAFWTSAALVLVMLTATIVSSAGWFQARKKSQQLLQASKEIEVQKQEIEVQKQEVEAVNDFLNEEILLAPAPSDEPGRGRNATIEEVIRRAVDTLDAETESAEGRFSNMPLVEARIRSTIGVAFTELGKFELAERLLSRALELYEANLEPDSPEIHLAKYHLGMQELWQMRYRRARQLFEEATHGLSRVLGEDAPATYRTRLWWAWAKRRSGGIDEAIETLNGLIERFERGEIVDNEYHGLAIVLLASIYGNLHNGAHTNRLLNRLDSLVLSTREWSPFNAMTYEFYRAYAKSAVSEDASAVELYSNVLPRLRETLGLGHNHTQLAINNLASSLMVTGRPNEAKKMLEELRDASDRSGNQRNANRARHNLAYFHENTGDSIKAADIFLESYYGSQNNTHFRFALDRYRIGGVPDKATELVNSEVDKRIRELRRAGPPDSDFLKECLYFTYQLGKAGYFDAMRQLAEVVLDRKKSSAYSFPKPSHKFYWLLNLGEAQMRTNKLDEAIKTLHAADRETSAITPPAGSKGSYYFLHDPYWPRQLLGRVYLKSGQLGQAESHLKAALFGFADAFVGNGDTKHLLRELDRLLLLSDRSSGDVQSRLVKECVAYVRKVHEDQPWSAIYVADALLKLGVPEGVLLVLDKSEAKPTAFNTLQNWARDHTRCEALLQLDRTNEAETIADRISKRPESAGNWRLKYIHAEIARKRNALDDAEKLISQSLRQANRGNVPVSDVWRVAKSMFTIHQTLLKGKTSVEELSCWSIAYDAPEQNEWGDMKFGTWVIMSLQAAGEYEACAKLAKKYVDHKPQGLVIDTNYQCINLNVFGSALMALGRYNEALPHLELARLYNSHFAAPGNWQFYTRGLVGDCYAGLKRFVEAEELLIEAFDGFEANYQSELINDYEKEFLDRVDALIQLYEQWHAAEPDKGHDTEIERWNDKKKRIEQMFAPNQELVR